MNEADSAASSTISEQKASQVDVPAILLSANKSSLTLHSEQNETKRDNSFSNSESERSSNPVSRTSSFWLLATVGAFISSVIITIMYLASKKALKH